MRTYIYPHEDFAEKDVIAPGAWIRTEFPTREDLDFLIGEIGIPEEFLNDIADTDERPRTEEEDGWYLTIIRVPVEMRLENGPGYSTVPVGIISNPEKELLVSVCYYQTRVLPDFYAFLRRKNIEVNTHTDIILRLIFSSAVWFLKYLKQINVEVTQAQDMLERSVNNDDLLLLMKLQKCLVYFNTSIRGNEAILGKIRTQHRREIDEDLIEDVIIEMRQAANMVNIYSDILTGTMDAFASIISNNVNTIMKRMTSISIALMLPTLIASFYGMNVKIGNVNVDDPYHFYYVIGASVLLSIVAFITFRRLRWI